MSEKTTERMEPDREDREHEKFGEHGFETVVAEVGRIEAALGIADLAQFTA